MTVEGFNIHIMKKYQLGTCKWRAVFHLFRTCPYKPLPRGWGHPIWGLRAASPQDKGHVLGSFTSFPVMFLKL